MKMMTGASVPIIILLFRLFWNYHLVNQKYF